MAKPPDNAYIFNEVELTNFPKQFYDLKKEGNNNIIIARVTFNYICENTMMIDSN